MSKSYLNLVTKSQVIKESEETPKESLKDAITTFAANLGSEVNIYEALRKFIEKYTEDIDRKAELLDTIEFCEADEADLESTLIKLKIAMDNPVLSESRQLPAEQPSIEIPRQYVGQKIEDLPFDLQEEILDAVTLIYKKLGKSANEIANVIDKVLDSVIQEPGFVKSLSGLIDYHVQSKNDYKAEKRKQKVIKQKTPQETLSSAISNLKSKIKHAATVDSLEQNLLDLQDKFFNMSDSLPKELIPKFETDFENLWSLIDSKNALNKTENIKVIDKDFLITESDVTKAVKTNKNDTPRKELDPVRCFVVLDKNDMPMLNKGGIVITNTPDAEQQIQQRADDLYRLIHNAKAVYVIEDEAYDKCVDIRDKKEYVRFVIANGRLIKASEAGKAIETHDLDNDDFLLNVEEMFE